MLGNLKVLSGNCSTENLFTNHILGTCRSVPNLGGIEQTTAKNFRHLDFSDKLHHIFLACNKLAEG